MPSWSARFLSSSNATLSSTPAPSTRSTPANNDRPLPRPPPRSNSGPERAAYARFEESGSVAVPIRANTTSRPHSRSISHSLGIFRKRSNPHSNGNLGIDSSSDDGLASGPEDLLSTSPAKKTGAKAEDKETSIAHCMTCDSSVQVPRGTMTFKCPTCIAVNDVQPRVVDTIKSKPQERSGISSNASSLIAPKRKGGNPDSVGRRLVSPTIC